MPLLQSILLPGQCLSNDVMKSKNLYRIHHMNPPPDQRTVRTPATGYMLLILPTTNGASACAGAQPLLTKGWRLQIASAPYGRGGYRNHCRRLHLHGNGQTRRAPEEALRHSNPLEAGSLLQCSGIQRAQNHSTVKCSTGAVVQSTVPPRIQRQQVSSTMQQSAKHCVQHSTRHRRHRRRH